MAGVCVCVHVCVCVRACVRVRVCGRALFRDAETNDPLTPRHPYFPHRPSDPYVVTPDIAGCSSATRFLPGTNVIGRDTGNGRGFPCTGINNPLDCPQYFSTPRAVNNAREYFDCPTLLGPEIENQQDASACAVCVCVCM